MQYVIDASVAVKWFLPEPDSDKADTLLEAFLRDGLDLVAPDLIVPEVGNTLWKRSVLRQEVSVSHARESYMDFLSLKLPLHPSSSIAELAFNLACQEGHRIYDALYLALALERGCDLLTSDQTFVNKLSQKFPRIRSLSSI